MGETNERHEELSDKIFDMGYALHEEGGKKNDYIISSTGDIMILISGIMHSKEDIKLFSELCSMFSAKKILEAKLDISDIAPKSEEEIEEMLRKLKSQRDFRDEDDEDDEDDDLNTDLGTSL